MTDMRIDTPAEAPTELPDLSTLPSCAPDNPLEALSWLGETVEEVAEGLRARGIKGKRSRAGECPLACYLTTWWHQAHVWRSYGVADENGVWGEIRLTPVRLFEFTQQFDNGSFPDLIDNG